MNMGKVSNALLSRGSAKFISQRVFRNQSSSGTVEEFRTWLEENQKENLERPRFVGTWARARVTGSVQLRARATRHTHGCNQLGLHAHL